LGPARSLRPILYLDTPALVKLYVREEGREELLSEPIQLTKLETDVRGARMSGREEEGPSFGESYASNGLAWFWARESQRPRDCGS